jgi:hypothetical protein
MQQNTKSPVDLLGVIDPDKPQRILKAMRRRRSAMLGVLVVGFVGATMTGACGAPSESACPAEDVAPPDTDTATECPASTEVPCMRYRIPLVGNPSTDVALRNKYIAAFGTACYMSEFDTFDCFYREWQAACADAAKIGEVSGNAPYKKGYTCQPVTGTEDYTLQVGSDVANKITINYQAAPRQTPLVEVDGVPTEVSGPYRNLQEPPTLGSGQPFNKCDSGMVDQNGDGLTQTQYILQVNSKANNGAIHSDLAGFEYPCGVDENCRPKTCKEQLVLKAGPPSDPDAAQVHHVVPMNDKRGCSWGTNSNKNAAVISRRLNLYFTNNNPPAEEVKILNNAAAYAP